jgi:hypothetical protein
VEPPKMMCSPHEVVNRQCNLVFWYVETFLLKTLFQCFSLLRYKHPQPEVVLED